MLIQYSSPSSTAANISRLAADFKDTKTVVSQLPTEVIHNTDTSMNRSSITDSQPTTTSADVNKTGTEEPPRPEAKMFRRCSLEYTRQNSDKKLTSSSSSSDLKASDATRSNPSLSLGSISASRRRPRRSSLKTSSTSFTSTGSTISSSSKSSSISATKFVTFSLDVNVRPIAPKSEAELKVLWLSKDERQAIQLQANADLRVLKRIAKIPKEVQASDPEIRALRNTISIRGLEQFSSKKLHKALWAIQHDHLTAVLEAQDVQRELNRRYGHPIKDTELAKVSMERSRLSRDRATKQGKEDEAAVMGYLGRNARPAGTHSTSSSTAFTSCGSRSSNEHHCHLSRSTSQGRRASHYHRRGSMPTTSIEMERAATRRSVSCSTNTPASATSNSAMSPRATPTCTPSIQLVRSNPGSRTNSLSHGMKRVQSSVDSLLTRVALATRGDCQSKNAPGSNATFDDAVVLWPPSVSISTPTFTYKREDTALLEPFVYPRPSGSRRNTMI